MAKQLNKNPRIIMSTIHGAKGGEADKVLLNAGPNKCSVRNFWL